MSWNLIDLDDETRRRMLDEFDNDRRVDAVFPSKVVEAARTADYLDAHRDAFASGTPESFAAGVRGSGMLRERQDNGNRVNPDSASSRIADGQFNVYYTRAVAARAAEVGGEVEIYRARPSSNPRPESEARIGTRLNAEALLTDLRDNSTAPGNFSVLPEVNSGLSVRLID